MPDPKNDNERRAEKLINVIAAMHQLLVPPNEIAKLVGCSAEYARMVVEAYDKTHPAGLIVGSKKKEVSTDEQ